MTSTEEAIMSAKLDMIHEEVKSMVNLVREMREGSCPAGKEHSKRIDRMESSINKMVIVVGVIVVGGQTGIEALKHFLSL